MPCPRSNHCHQPPVAACLQEKGRIRENTSCRHTQHYTEPPITPTFLWERWFHREFPGNAGIVAERPLPQLESPHANIQFSAIAAGAHARMAVKGQRIIMQA